MVPRLHKRGTSFKGACAYVLHDPGSKTSKRVAWVLTRNIHTDPDDAWFEMFDTYRNRTRLKRNAGVDLRGRDNKTPVLHYTLAWHADDKPEPQHMRAVAVGSLAALGLSEHEAIIVGHADKPHPHVHIVANTVHPYTGKTAPLKFSKLQSSKWAEAYEQEHGLHCLERVKNNERRRQLANAREAERREALHEMSQGHMPPAPKPYEPVKDHSPDRRQWFERKDIIEKMKALRAALDQEQARERAATSDRHRQEFAELNRQTRAAIAQARTDVKKAWNKRWSALYASHASERALVMRLAARPLSRAAFVFRNRMRLGDEGAPLPLWRMIPFVYSKTTLTARMLQVWARDKAELARAQKLAAKQQGEKLKISYHEKLQVLRDRQRDEREAERSRHDAKCREITLARAKAVMLRERQERQAMPSLPEPANESRKPPSADMLVREAQVSPGVPIVTPAPNAADVPKRRLRRASAAEALLGAAASPVPNVPAVPDYAEDKRTRAFHRPDSPQPGRRVPSLRKTFRRWRHRNIRRDFDCIK